MPDIRMPDGAVVRFPDNMPPEQIRAMITSKFPQAAGGGQPAPAPDAAPQGSMGTPEAQAALQAAAASARQQQALPEPAAPRGDAPPGTAVAGGTPPAQPNNDPLATITKLLGVPGPQQAAAAVRGAVDTGTFGFGDEGAAALGVKPFEGNWGGQYQAGLDKVRGEQAAAQQAHPAEYLGGQVGGAVATSLIPGLGVGGDAARAAGLGMKVARGVVSGAAQGAAYGAGSANGDLADRARGAVVGAGIGAATGGAVPVVGKAVGAALGGKAAAPAIDAIKSQASALYDAANNAGVVIRPQSFENLGNRLNVALKDTGFSPDVQTQTAAALKPIQRDIAAGAAPTLTDVDNYRKVLVNVGRLSTDPAERKVAGTALDTVDNWLSNLSPRDASAGDPKTGFALIGQARDLWRTQAKAQKIEDLIYDGTGNVRPDNEIKNGFTALRRNKNKLRGFTDEEKQAVATVANGGFGGKTKQVLAAFDPHNPVVAGLWTAAGLTTPVGWAALPLAAGAIVAKRALGAGIKSAANNASAIVRNGGTAPGPSLRALAIENGTNQALTPLARGGAVPSLLNLLPGRAVAQ